MMRDIMSVSAPYHRARGDQKMDVLAHADAARSSTPSMNGILFPYC